MYWNKERFEEQRKDWVFDTIHEDGPYREYFFHDKKTNNMSARIFTSPYSVAIYGDYGAPIVFNTRTYCPGKRTEDVLSMPILTDELYYEYTLEKMALRSDNNVQEFINIKAIKEMMLDFFQDTAQVDNMEEKEWLNHPKVQEFLAALDDFGDFVDLGLFYRKMQNVIVPIENYNFDFDSKFSFIDFLHDHETMSEYDLPKLYSEDFNYAIQVIHRLAKFIQMPKGENKDDSKLKKRN